MDASRNDARAAATERRKGFGLLLFAIVTVFVLQGVADPGRWEQVIVSVLLAVTVLLALRVGEVRPRLTRPIALLGLILVALSVVEAAAGHANAVTVRLADLLLVALAPPVIVLGIMRTLQARNQVTMEAVFGVLCLYLLLGMFFAFLYGAIGRIDETFFAQDVRVTAARCLYFSFATLTTVGYGDLTAASNLGHTLSVFESLLGQIYLVTVVSVIVGNLGMKRAHRPPIEGELTRTR